MAYDESLCINFYIKVTMKIIRILKISFDRVRLSPNIYVKANFEIRIHNLEKFSQGSATASAWAKPGKPAVSSANEACINL